MGTKRSTQNLPAELERTRRRFEGWRRTRRVRTRIPESLWAAAVKMAGLYGICRTAKALRLDYYALKERVDKQATSAADYSDTEGKATFLELAVPSGGAWAECMLELDSADGTRKRIHLKGVEVPDLIALSRSLWEVEP